MPPTRRERLRQAMIAEIKEVARQQMSEVGAAALSMRAIARQIGITAPALYRYFSNRDALVTALIVAAYSSLAEAMEAADSEQERHDYDGRFRAIATAYRQWALSHAQDYTLIYGTPIPGYHAPRDQTVAPASRTFQTIGRIITDAWRAGTLTSLKIYNDLSDDLQQTVNELLHQLPEDNVPIEAITLTMLIWSQLHGLVWGELYGHFLPGLAESGELYQIEVQAISERLGF